MFFKKVAVKIISKRQEIMIGTVRILLVLAILGSIYELNWMSLFVSSLALFLSYLPDFLSRHYKVILPNSLQIFIIFFIFAGLFLGEVRSFYIKFWWWDSLLHLLSGIALGFAGFLIIYIFYKAGKFQANHFLVAVLAFSFALALGTLWEIFEFFMDELFYVNMQKARNLCEAGVIYCDTRLGVADTMRDLILDSIGALSASIVGYIYLKKKGPSFFHKLIKEFEEKNKHLFLKK